MKSRSFNKAKFKVLHIAGGNPGFTGWGMKGLRATLLRRIRGYWWLKAWIYDSTVHPQPGLHQQQCAWQVEGGDFVLPLFFCKTPLPALLQLWGVLHKKNVAVLE